MIEKVWGGLVFVSGKQVRAIIKARSQKAASEIAGVPLSQFREYWSETGNNVEIGLAVSGEVVILSRDTLTSG